MKCIKEKCPKYEHFYGRYICKLDNSSSQFNLIECRIDEFFQRIEKDYIQLRFLCDLIKSNQTK